mmetsp:Transcript_25898/g.56771  ORF Transcript_25898/g.56771 Transcript_25898/m.56771 type:complete len:246 (-) Transcript_25898:656-1393(-)
METSTSAKHFPVACFRANLRLSLHFIPPAASTSEIFICADPRILSLPLRSSSSNAPASRSTALMRRNSVCSRSSSTVPTLVPDALASPMLLSAGNQATAGVSFVTSRTFARIFTKVGSKTVAFCTSSSSVGTTISSNFTRSKCRESGPLLPGLTKFSHSKRRTAVPAGEEEEGCTGLTTSSPWSQLSNSTSCSDWNTRSSTGMGGAAAMTLRRNNDLLSHTLIPTSWRLSKTRKSCFSFHSGLVE